MFGLSLSVKLKTSVLAEGSIEEKSSKLGQKGGAISNTCSRAIIVTWIQNIACGGLSIEVGLNNVK